MKNFIVKPVRLKAFLQPFLVSSMQNYKADHINTEFSQCVLVYVLHLFQIDHELHSASVGFQTV